MAKICIYVSDEMRDDMARFGRFINWSQIARSAFANQMAYVAGVFDLTAPVSTPGSTVSRGHDGNPDPPPMLRLVRD